MKRWIAFLCSQVAATCIGVALYNEGGRFTAEHGYAYPLHFIAFGAWAWALWRDIEEERAAESDTIGILKECLEEIRAETPSSPQDAFHRDVCAVAYGELDELEFDRRWAGRVPASPRPPRRKDRQIELFKEIMTDPKYAADPSDNSFRDKLAAEIQKELERPSTRTWACTVTLGIHEDGPCTCVEVHEHADPAFRKGQYVRFLPGEFVRDPEKLWRVIEVVPCHGPKGAFWWGYYVDDADGHTLHPWESELVLALPRAGEWWESAPCDRHPESYPARKMAVDITANHLETVWVRCGCLVPVNFGRGC